MSYATWKLRIAFTVSDNKRDRGLTTPPDIERWDDVCYGSDRKWQMLDVYRPKGTTGRLPVIVSVHGGGWTYGDKERYQWYCMSLAQRGFAVVNFTYRLAPEFKFPSGIEDTNLVFSWMMRNNDWFDLNRVYAVGDSAGGHMLTIYAAACTNPAYAKKLGICIPKLPDGRGFVPNGLGLNCGVYQIKLSGTDVNRGTKALMKALLCKYGSPEEEDLINPIPYITPAFPKAYVMTANKDMVAGPAAKGALVQRLKELHVPFIDVTYGDEKEPLGHVFHCNMRLAAGAKCNDDECRFFLMECGNTLLS